MRVLSRKALREFAARHAESGAALTHWYHVTRKAVWANLVEVRKDFPHADSAGGFTVFNVGGNRYRLITRIDYRYRLVFVRYVLTLREYNKGKSKP